MREPPILRGYPLVGAAPLILKPLAAIAEAHARYGDFVKVSLGVLGSLYLAFHPDDVKEVFMNGRRLHRGLMRELLGPGLFVAPSSDTSRRHRRLMQPAFHASHLATLVDTIAETTAATLDARWPRPGEPTREVDVVDELKRMTISITVRVTLGEMPEAELRRAEDALCVVADYLDEQLFTRVKIPRSWPTRWNRLFRSSMRELHAIIQRKIEDHRRAGRETADLLSMFVGARDADTGEQLSDVELHDELLSTFVAGIETTYMAITWTLFFLAHNPPTRDALRAEVVSALGPRRPTFADLGSIAYARMAVQESLRLYPVAWGMLRTLTRDLTLHGYPIPEGSRVFVCPYVTGRHPAFWPEPERFDPTRFTPDKVAARPRFAHFPFGGGAHQCIGNEFALMESQIVVAMLAQRYEISMDPVKDLKTRARIALQPDPHPLMRVKSAPLSSGSDRERDETLQAST